MATWLFLLFFPTKGKIGRNPSRVVKIRFELESYGVSVPYNSKIIQLDKINICKVCLECGNVFHLCLSTLCNLTEWSVLQLASKTWL